MVQAWVDRWFSPQTVVVIVGFIIWLVQLNFAVMTLTDAMAKLDGTVNTNSRNHIETSSVLNRTVILLDNMDRRMEKLEESVESHEKEAEQWKRKIIQLEQGK